MHGLIKFITKLFTFKKYYYSGYRLEHKVNKNKVVHQYMKGNISMIFFS